MWERVSFCHTKKGFLDGSVAMTEHFLPIARNLSCIGIISDGVERMALKFLTWEVQANRTRIMARDVSKPNGGVRSLIMEEIRMSILP